MSARVVRVSVYPFKSLDGLDVDSAHFTVRGGLRWDRAFAFVDDEDFVNAKREPLVHQLRVAYDDGPSHATLRSEVNGSEVSFGFDDAPGELEAFVSAHVGAPVRLQRDDLGGFPDDVQAPGPTVVSTATLETVASWFDGMTADDVRLRLRANIEVDGVPAFWEDRLVGRAGALVRFQIGPVEFGGVNPCARCIVPSRDARTGESLPTFQKRVSEQRKATLPEWAERSRFDHYYRLTVNTKTLMIAGPVSVGDAVAIGEPADV